MVLVLCAERTSVPGGVLAEASVLFCSTCFTAECSSPVTGLCANVLAEGYTRAVVSVPGSCMLTVRCGHQASGQQLCRPLSLPPALLSHSTRWLCFEPPQETHTSAWCLVSKEPCLVPSSHLGS